MSTFGTLQTVIADEINKTNLGSQIRRAIVASMKKYRDRRLKFNYSVSTISTSDSVSTYSLPDGFMGDDLIEMVDGSFNDTLTKRDYHYVADIDNHDSYKSEPRIYSIIDGSNFRVFPTPNNASNSSTGDYTMLFHYHKDLNASGISGAISASSTDGATNAWLTDGFDLIRCEAKIYIYNNILRGQEPKMEAMALQQERNDYLKALVKEYQKSVGSGSMAPSDRQRSGY